MDRRIAMQKTDELALAERVRPKRLKPRSVTLIGYLALALSVLVVAGTAAFIIQIKSLDSGNVIDPAWLDEAFWSVSIPLILIGTPAAIILDTIAGFRGRGNRIMGVISGVLLLVIPMIIAVDHLVNRY
jgi:hypothetical protein